MQSSHVSLINERKRRYQVEQYLPTLGTDALDLISRNSVASCISTRNKSLSMHGRLTSLWDNPASTDIGALGMHMASASRLRLHVA